DPRFPGNKQDLPLSRKHLIVAGSYPGQRFVSAHHSLRWNRGTQEWRFYRRGTDLSGRCNRTDEPITSTVCGVDKPGMAWIVAKGFPELAHEDLQDSVADKRARPDGFVEFLFGNKAAGTTNQIVEQHECLGPESYRF